MLPLLIFHGASLNQSFAQVYVDSTYEANIPATDCINTVWNIYGALGASNHTFNGATVNIVGFNITVDIEYNLGIVVIPPSVPFTQSVNLGVLSAGTYNVTTKGLLDGTLTSTLNASLTVNSCCPVAASFNLSDSVACELDFIQCTNNSIAATGQSWYLNNSYVSSAINYSFTPSFPGTYIVKLVSSDGSCMDSTEQTLVVNTNPPVWLGPDSIICDGDSIILDAFFSGLTYLWQDASSNSTYTVLYPGNYWVTVTDDNGCISTDSVFVEVEVCNASISENKTNDDYIIFPNPAAESFSIWSETNQLVSIFINDVTGKMIYNRNVNGSQNYIIDCSDFANGLYIVNCIDGNGVVGSKRLVVQH